jgi:hypothetical protein
VQEIFSPHAAMQFISTSDMVAIVPSHFEHMHYSGVAVRPLKPAQTLSVVIAWRSEAVTPLLATLMDLLDKK